MSTSSVSVHVASEVDAVVVALRDLLIAIKSGKSPSEIAVQELPVIIQLVGQVSQLPEDFRLEMCSSLRSIGIRGAEIVSVLVDQYKP